MGRFRGGGNPDRNQPTIVAGLRQIPGVSVAITSGVADGFPDIAVGYRGRTYLFEIKDPAKVPSARRLTEKEEAFHSVWRGHVGIALTLDQILEHIGLNGNRTAPGESPGNGTPGGI